MVNMYELKDWFILFILFILILVIFIGVGFEEMKY